MQASPPERIVFYFKYSTADCSESASWFRGSVEGVKGCRGRLCLDDAPGGAVVLGDVATDRNLYLDKAGEGAPL